MLGDIILIYSLIVKCSQGKKVLTMRVSVVVDLTLYTFMYRGLPGKGLTAVFFICAHVRGGSRDDGRGGCTEWRLLSCVFDIYLTARFPNRFLL